MGNILESAYTDINNGADDERPPFTDPALDVDAEELFRSTPALDFSWIRAKTGPGTIESYLDHPLNTSSSKGVAQMLRGATGLFGALDLAIIDIGLGAVEVLRERKGAAARENVTDHPGQ